MSKNKLLNILLIIGVLSVLSVFSAVAQDVTVIQFWSSEFQPNRVEVQQGIIERFQEANPGVLVQLTTMDENVMDQLMTINVASGTPPDVILHPLQLTAKWYNQGLLDADFATQVIQDLGEETFSPGALALVTTPDGNYAAIPSDGWGQLLVYRKDLFDEAGLEAPTSYESIMAAAEYFHNPDENFLGFLGPNSPSELYTWQVFEHIALANGANFVDAEGNITFNTPEMVEAIQYYADLMSNYGTDEAGWYWLQTRAAYFAGDGAMVVWSPFILDEMAGLRDSDYPSCDECADNPAYLAENSGIVSAISGYSSDNPAAWGSVNSLGLGPNASEEAQAFIEFWMNEAYLDGLGIAPEGKFPMRRGTVENPTAYVDGWADLEVGVDRRAKLSEYYSPEQLEIVINGSDGYTRMGYDVGQSVLASAVSAQFFIQENLAAVINGELTAEEAAEEIQIAIEDLQFELEN